MDAIRDFEQMVNGCLSPCLRHRQLARQAFFVALGIAFFLGLFLGVAVASAEEGAASWYSTECCRYNPDPRCPTASGTSLYELEQRRVLFAAMWDVPLGSTVRVCRVDSPGHLLSDKRVSRCIEARVLDRGPARRLGRLIDLNRRAFAQLADPREGVIRVTVEQQP